MRDSKTKCIRTFLFVHNFFVLLFNLFWLLFYSFWMRPQQKYAQYRLPPRVNLIACVIARHRRRHRYCGFYRKKERKGEREQRTDAELLTRPPFSNKLQQTGTRRVAREQQYEIYWAMCHLSQWLGLSLALALSLSDCSSSRWEKKSTLESDWWRPNRTDRVSVLRSRDAGAYDADRIIC